MDGVAAFLVVLLDTGFALSPTFLNCFGDATSGEFWLVDGLGDSAMLPNCILRLRLVDLEVVGFSADLTDDGFLTESLARLRGTLLLEIAEFSSAARLRFLDGGGLASSSFWGVLAFLERLLSVGSEPRRFPLDSESPEESSNNVQMFKSDSSSGTSSRIPPAFDLEFGDTLKIFFLPLASVKSTTGEVVKTQLIGSSLAVVGDGNRMPLRLLDGLLSSLGRFPSYSTRGVLKSTLLGGEVSVLEEPGTAFAESWLVELRRRLEGLFGWATIVDFLDKSRASKRASSGLRSSGWTSRSFKGVSFSGVISPEEV